jgi:hypothetical protein
LWATMIVDARSLNGAAKTSLEWTQVSNTNGARNS